jgi:hypothetical protein
MLCNENCSLKSLSLTSVKIVDDAGIALIATGLAKNKSVKCFRFVPSETEALVSLFLSLQGSSLDVLEKCEMRGRFKYEHEIRDMVGPMWSCVAKQIPMLKSLNLSDKSFELGIWRSIFSTVLSSSSNLRELVLKGVVCNEVLRELGPLLVNNATLKVLDISNNYGVSSEEWTKFFSSVQASTLEKIDLSLNREFDFRIASSGDSGILSVSNWLPSNQTVKVLKISCRRRSEAMLLFSKLASQTIIEKIDLGESEDKFADVLVDILPVNSRLKRVCLPVFGVDQLRTVASALQLPGCPLEELRVEFYNKVWFPRKEMARIFVDALNGNSTMKILQFEIMFMRLMDESLDPSIFVSLLCDKSSIDATYHSNHTLQSIHFGHYCVDSIELDSLLYANRDTNKHAVARQKVVENHTFDYVSFASSSLPRVLSWVGNADIDDRLSRMYGILRRVPHVIRNFSIPLQYGGS